MSRIYNFWKKYTFPLHLYQAFDIFTTKFSVLVSTLRLKKDVSLLACRCGRNVRTDGTVIIHIQSKGAITLGENVKFLSRLQSTLVGFTNPTVLQCIGEDRIGIGNNTSCTSTISSTRTNIQIGDNLKVGENVRIFDRASLTEHQVYVT